MVDAGIARKVDFGEGRFRFEHSYRHPRHFHLICKSCNRSFEFLSSDIEALIEEVAAARSFARAAERAADSRHVRSVPDRPARRPSRAGRPSCCSPATRCASRSRPSAAAWSSTRAPRASPRRPRPRGVREARRPRRRSTSARSRARYRELLQQDPQLESRPTFLFFKGAANGLFAAGAEQLRQRRRRSAGAA